MPMDPVVALMEELRMVEAAMDVACKKNAACYSRGRAEEINAMLCQVKNLYADILDTAPTSPLGASILIRIAAGRMPFRYARYTNHLHLIADRLEDGQRLHGDLVWLRGVAGVLTQSGEGKGAELGMLLARAIRGIARPVVVFRAVLPPATTVPDWQELALGPH